MSNNVDPTMQNIIQAWRTNFAQFLQQFDSNRDGTLDINEVNTAFMQSGKKQQEAWAMTQAIFSALDRNQDNRLTVAEVMGQVAQGGGGQPVMGWGQPPAGVSSQVDPALIQGWRINFAQLLQQFDSNRDGTLDINEVNTAFLQSGKNQQEAWAMTQAIFSALDRNQDNRLTVAEVMGQVAQGGGGQPVMGWGQPPVGVSSQVDPALIQGWRTNFAQLLQQFDSNRDGTLDINEVNIAFLQSGKNQQEAWAMTQAIFSALDRNQNNRLTVAEVIEQVPAVDSGARLSEGVTKLRIPASGGSYYEVVIYEEQGIFDIPSANANDWYYTDKFFNRMKYSSRYERYSCNQSAPKSCIESAEFIIKTFLGRNPVEWKEGQSATPYIYSHWGNGIINISTSEHVETDLTGKTPYPFTTSTQGYYTQLVLGTGVMIGNITTTEQPFNVHLGAIVAYEKDFQGFIISDVSEEGPVSLIKPWRIMGINKPDNFRGELYKNPAIFALGLLNASI